MSRDLIRVHNGQLVDLDALKVRKLESEWEQYPLIDVSGHSQYYPHWDESKVKIVTSYINASVPFRLKRWFTPATHIGRCWVCGLVHIDGPRSTNGAAPRYLGEDRGEPCLITRFGAGWAELGCLQRIAGTQNAEQVAELFAVTTLVDWFNWEYDHREFGGSTKQALLDQCDTLPKLIDLLYIVNAPGLRDAFKRFSPGAAWSYDSPSLGQIEQLVHRWFVDTAPDVSLGQPELYSQIHRILQYVEENLHYRTFGLLTRRLHWFVDQYMGSSTTQPAADELKPKFDLSKVYKELEQRSRGTNNGDLDDEFARFIRERMYDPNWRERNDSATWTVRSDNNTSAVYTWRGPVSVSWTNDPPAVPSAAAQQRAGSYYYRDGHIYRNNGEGVPDTLASGSDDVRNVIESLETGIVGYVTPDRGTVYLRREADQEQPELNLVARARRYDASYWHNAPTVHRFLFSHYLLTGLPDPSAFLAFVNAFATQYPNHTQGLDTYLEHQLAVELPPSAQVIEFLIAGISRFCIDNSLVVRLGLST